nr:lytic transglycosylase domain-containing protein [Sphingosinicella soli]
MIHAITRQESRFDPTAISRAGARGLMQLMPGTARETAGKMGMSYRPEALLGDPNYNVQLGSTYYLNLVDQWGGNHMLAIASYNAGAGNVRKWINANGDPRLPSVDAVRWVEEIPFMETRGYVRAVLENAVVYDRLSPARAGQPSTNTLSAWMGKNRPG